MRPACQLIAAAIALTAVPASVGAVEAIQERSHRYASEWTVGVGYLPMDPYTKGLSGSLGTLLHLSDSLAWRVFEAAYVLEMPTDLRRDLENNFAVFDGRFERTEALAITELVFQPLYGRESFMNRGSWTTGAHLAVGGGVVLQRTGADRALGGVGVVGVGLTWHVSNDFALRFEARDLLRVRASEDLEHVLYLTVAGALGVGER